MPKEPKFYTVWRGNETGVFDSWEACRKAVEGYRGAIYKSFPSRELAWKAFESNYADHIGKNTRQSRLSPAQLKAIGRPIDDSISVDAACNGVTGLMEYQGVDTKSGARIFHRGPFKDGTNNVGEFLAIVHALAFCKQRNLAWPIYTDSRTAMSWVRNRKAKTRLTPTPANPKLFELIARAEQWLKNNHWENPILKWETGAWGEIPADFGRK